MLNYHAKRLQGKLYETIDFLPIYNWWQIHKTHDFAWLYLNKPVKVGKYTNRVLRTQWRRVYDGYIAQFGLSDNYLKIVELMKEIAALKVQRMESGDRTLNTFIKIAEYNLSELQKENTSKDGDFFDTKTALEENVGFRIDPHVISVAEFYSHIRRQKAKSKPTK